MSRICLRSIVISLLYIAYGNISFGQERDFSLAKVGQRIYGVYVFFGCEPANPYTFIKTIEVKIDLTDSYQDSFEKIIDRAKKKESNFNGIIFQTENLNRADLIRFDDLESSRDGFSYGTKVSFLDSKQVFVGEVVDLARGNKNPTVNFRNVFNENETKRIDIEKLTPISDEIFQEKLGEIAEQSENYKFFVGEKVTWISSNVLGQNKEQFTGEIIAIDNKTHKASIRYINSENAETISDVSFLDLNRVN